MVRLPEEGVRSVGAGAVRSENVVRRSDLEAVRLMTTIENEHELYAAADEALTGEPPSIHVLLARVARDVPVVGKDQTNDSQGFSFRGIDGVLNAVGPAFRSHGIIVMPERRELVSSTVKVGKNRTEIGHVVVTVAYHFWGPAGDELVAVVDGEAMDSGDKAVSKAYSVAYRTALLQILAIPTHQKDPDEDSYQRSDALPSKDDEAKDAGFPSETTRAREHRRVAELIKQLPEDQRGPFQAFREEHGWPVSSNELDELEQAVTAALEAPFEEAS